MAGKRYKVIITDPAFDRYSSTILPYLKKFFSSERTLEIQKAIEETVKSLLQMPRKGSKAIYLIDPKVIVTYFTKKVAISLLKSYTLLTN